MHSHRTKFPLARPLDLSDARVLARYAKDDYIGAFNAWQMMRVLVFSLPKTSGALLRHPQVPPTPPRSQV